jgi:hypothetical protein
MARDMARYEDAEKYCRRSLAVAEQLGDRRARGFSLHQLGGLAHFRGDFGNALKTIWVWSTKESGKKTRLRKCTTKALRFLEVQVIAEAFFPL